MKTVKEFEYKGHTVAIKAKYKSKGVNTSQSIFIDRVEERAMQVCLEAINTI